MSSIWKKLLSLTVSLGLMVSTTFSFGTLDQTKILKENDRQVGVFELQRALKELGFFTATETTNLYGKQTIEAVKAFQSSLKMSADGVSGTATIKAIRDHQLSKRNQVTLKLGVSDARVALLKSDLKELGYLKTATGTTFDQSLDTALKAFQKKAGLKADGKAGDGTLEAITTALATKRGYTTAQTAKASTSQTAATQKTTVTQAAKTAATTSTASAATTAKATTTKQASSRGAEAVRLSKTYLGVDYVYGGASAKGFDCSGFTMYIMNKNGVSLPHGATAQYAYGTAVKKADLQAGDLVFFKTTDAPIGHVGIYIGNNQFIHASSAKYGVIISNLGTYGGKYVGARRVL